MNKKIIYLVSFLILLLIIVFFVKLFAQSKQQEPEQTPPPSVVNSLIIPPAKKELAAAVSNIYNRQVGLTENIEIYFDKPLPRDAFTVNISPDVQTEQYLSLDGKTFIIRPLHSWKFDTKYSINIDNNPSSQSQTILDQEYSFEFKTKQLTGM